MYRTALVIKRHRSPYLLRAWYRETAFSLNNPVEVDQRRCGVAEWGLILICEEIPPHCDRQPVELPGHHC